MHVNFDLVYFKKLALGLMNIFSIVNIEAIESERDFMGLSFPTEGGATETLPSPWTIPFECDGLQPNLVLCK